MIRLTERESTLRVSSNSLPFVLNPTIAYERKESTLIGEQSR